jgi:hypothetical protein
MAFGHQVQSSCWLRLSDDAIKVIQVIPFPWQHNLTCVSLTDLLVI